MQKDEVAATAKTCHESRWESRREGSWKRCGGSRSSWLDASTAVPSPIPFAHSLHASAPHNCGCACYANRLQRHGIHHSHVPLRWPKITPIRHSSPCSRREPSPPSKLPYKERQLNRGLFGPPQVTTRSIGQNMCPAHDNRRPSCERPCSAQARRDKEANSRLLCLAACQQE